MEKGERKLWQANAMTKPTAMLKATAATPIPKPKTPFHPRVALLATKQSPQSVNCKSCTRFPSFCIRFIFMSRSHSSNSSNNNCGSSCSISVSSLPAHLMPRPFGLLTVLAQTWRRCRWRAVFTVRTAANWMCVSCKKGGKIKCNFKLRHQQQQQQQQQRRPLQFSN